MNVKLLTICVLALLVFTTTLPLVSSMQLNIELKDIKINIKSDKKLNPYYPGIILSPLSISSNI